MKYKIFIPAVDPYASITILEIGRALLHRGPIGELMEKTVDG